ncbi:MAG: hypothetical protein IPJ01_11045 [Micavibrio sp.]|nr:hypothetical protein [Micavibrio sp.]
MVDGVTPYADVAEANSIISLTYRSIGLTVNIANVEYWYKDGVADIDLVLKGSGGIIVQQDGVDLPQELKLNVISPSLLATNDGINNRTNLDFTGDVCTLNMILDIIFGVAVDFDRLDGIPSTDIISGGLEIARNNIGWLYNPLAEADYSPTSPTGSKWVQLTDFSQISNITTQPYDDFITVVNAGVGSPDNLPNTVWIMKDLFADTYYALAFISWTPDVSPQYATNQLYNDTPIADGSIVTIGSRNYSYDALGDVWSNMEGGSYTLLADAINNDTLSEVTVSGILPDLQVVAKVIGTVGNSIVCSVIPAQANLQFFTPTLTGGSDGTNGGGFHYQRLQVIVNCDGTIHFADGTTQNTAPARIQNEGVTLPIRPLVDYIGSIVNVIDSGGKTQVIIDGAVRKIINVDATYGNNAQASLAPYNQAFSFTTLETAVAIAVAGDLIFVSAGDYSPSGSISKNGVDWYFCPNAIVTGSSPFQADAISFNIYGFGTFIGIGFASPFFYFNNGCKVNITCNKYVNQQQYYGCIYAQVGGNDINITCFGEIDCSYNTSIAFVSDSNSKITINSPIVKCSWGAYNCGTDSQIIANVNKTIMYDIAGDVTSLGNNYAGTFNGSINALIIVNGDLFTEQTIDGNTFYNGALLAHNGGGGTIILNGAKSTIRLARAVHISNSPNTHIIVLSEIENIQETGVSVSMNSGKATIKSKLKNADLSTTENILLNGGQLILDDAVLICGVGATESITAPAPSTIKVYSAYTNKPLNANVTNSIVGTSVIVDAGVE